MGTEQELRKLIAESTSVSASELTNDTPLITSGLLDSLALFNLAVWIENRLGSNLRLAEIDIPHEWNTLDSITAFIEKHSR